MATSLHGWKPCSTRPYDIVSGKFLRARQERFWWLGKFDHKRHKSTDRIPMPMPLRPGSYMWAAKLYPRATILPSTKKKLDIIYTVVVKYNTRWRDVPLNFIRHSKET
jgi:hypothetical protein